MIWNHSSDLLCIEKSFRDSKLGKSCHEFCVKSYTETKCDSTHFFPVATFSSSREKGFLLQRYYSYILSYGFSIGSTAGMAVAKRGSLINTLATLNFKYSYILLSHFRSHRIAWLRLGLYSYRVVGWFLM